MSFTKTTFQGAGFAGAGLTLSGFGTVSSTTVERTNLLVKKGPLTNKIGNSRFISDLTKDYIINENGYFEGGDIIQQQVYLALVTVQGSSSIQSLGQTFTNTETITDNFVQNITLLVNQALDNLISTKKIIVNAINIINQNNIIQVEVKWKNIATGVNFTNLI